MKTVSKLLLPLILLLGACSSSKFSQTAYQDDVYFVPSDEPKVVEPEAQAEDYPGDERFTETDEQYENYNSPQGTTEEYHDEEGNTYVTNNYNGDNYRFDYDDYYDYSYASRIRRFHRYGGGLSYYDPFYTNTYFYSYNPYDYGVSIYVSYNWWNPRPFSPWSIGFNYGYPYYGYHWPRPYYSPWYSYYPHYGYGGYAHGYHHGYQHGYWDGYNHGFYNGYYAGQNNPYYYNSLDPNVSGYYYAPRGSSIGTNAATRSQVATKNSVGAPMTLAEKFETAASVDESIVPAFQTASTTSVKRPSRMNLDEKKDNYQPQAPLNGNTNISLSQEPERKGRINVAPSEQDKAGSKMQENKNLGIDKPVDNNERKGRYGIGDTKPEQEKRYNTQPTQQNTLTPGKEDLKKREETPSRNGYNRSYDKPANESRDRYDYQKRTSPKINDNKPTQPGNQQPAERDRAPRRYDTPNQEKRSGYQYQQRQTQPSDNRNYRYNTQPNNSQPDRYSTPPRQSVPQSKPSYSRPNSGYNNNYRPSSSPSSRPSSGGTNNNSNSRKRYSPR